MSDTYEGLPCCFPKGGVSSFLLETKTGCYETKNRRPARHAGIDGPQDSGRVGIAARLWNRAANRADQRRSVAVTQGTLYPVLLMLEQEGAIASEWGTSENNRRARFYRLTREGHKQLQIETQDWEQTAAIIGRFFEAKAEDLS